MYECSHIYKGRFQQSPLREEPKMPQRLMSVGTSVCALAFALQPNTVLSQRLPTNESHAGAPSLDVITVTAQRREQSLQDVPLSILGVSGAAIERQRIERPDDLLLKILGAFFIPNVKTASYVGLRGFLSGYNRPRIFGASIGYRF